MWWRTSAASRTTSNPSTRARPSSGRSSVVSTRTAVVIPAPFGPSKPRMPPCGTVRSRPDSAWVEPKLLASRSVSMAGISPMPSLPALSYGVLVRALYDSSTMYGTQARLRQGPGERAAAQTPARAGAAAAALVSAAGPRQLRSRRGGAAGQEGVTVADDDELWAPFLAFRPEDRHATRLRRHVEEDMKRGARHVPRRAAALSRDEIVRAAIKVADAEGPDAVSMRRIARELSAGTMSLYWHVASKEELLDLMIDSVQGEELAPEPSGDWRADLRALTRGARAVLHRHPWMVDFIGGRPPVGPKSLQNIERALGSLDGLGLDKATVFTIVQTVGTYALGTVLREAQEITGERHLERQFAGLTDEERDAMLGEFMSQIRASGRYPHMASVIEAGIDPDAPETREARFEFGLDCLLDGIEARLPRPPGAAPPGAAPPGAAPPGAAP